MFFRNHEFDLSIKLSVASFSLQRMIRLRNSWLWSVHQIVDNPIIPENGNISDMSHFSI